MLTQTQSISSSYHSIPAPQRQKAIPGVDDRRSLDENGVGWLDQRVECLVRGDIGRSRLISDLTQLRDLDEDYIDVRRSRGTNQGDCEKGDGRYR